MRAQWTVHSCVSSSRPEGEIKKTQCFDIISLCMQLSKCHSRRL